MSIKRKIQRASLPKPPLSVLDKTVYVFFLLFGILSIIGFYVALMRLPQVEFAFTDESIVAAENTLLLLCASPMILFISLAIAIPAGLGLQKKQPIFGNKRFTPSFTKPVMKTFPLISKDFWLHLEEKSKRRMKKIGIVLAVLFLICAIILPFGFYPREILDRENNFYAYDFRNQQTHCQNIRDAEKMEIDIAYSSGRSSRCHLRIAFVFEDQTYHFYLRSFYGMTTEETLEYMLYLKSFFADGRYEITHAERVESLIWRRDFNASEAALLYKLFDCQP